MDKFKRLDRVAVLVKILTANPGKIYQLSYFADMFGAAKSTISEDIDIAKQTLHKMSVGALDTITGAAGGVRYLPTPSANTSKQFVEALCEKLSDPHRVLLGNFVYMADILNDPEYVSAMGEILASPFQFNRPDFVVTIETKGIPVALMTARALGVPLLVCRRDHKVTEGSLITINYVSGSTKMLQTMSLPKNAIVQGQKALIIDDFMKGGGSIKGITDMMKEFSASVIGVGVIIATREPEKKMVEHYNCLATLNKVDDENGLIDIKPSAWIKTL